MRREAPTLASSSPKAAVSRTSHGQDVMRPTAPMQTIATMSASRRVISILCLAASHCSEEVGIDIRPSTGCGLGAFASETVAAGCWICSYQGEVLTLLQVAQKYSAASPEYLFELSPTRFFDGNDTTHCSRYINHNEDGNLRFEISNSGGDAAGVVCEYSVDFYANRDIQSGIELTYDYGEAYWMGAGILPAQGTDSRFELVDHASCDTKLAQRLADEAAAGQAARAAYAAAWAQKEEEALSDPSLAALLDDMRSR